MTTLDRLNEVFRDVFDDDAMSVTRATSAAAVEGWDSITHVTLMVNVEKAFSIRFSSAQIALLKNVGELVDLIETKTKG